MHSRILTTAALVSAVTGFVLPDAQTPYFEQILTQQHDILTALGMGGDADVDVSTYANVGAVNALTQGFLDSASAAEDRHFHQQPHHLNGYVADGMASRWEHFPAAEWLASAYTDAMPSALEEWLTDQHEDGHHAHGPPAHDQPHGDHGHDGLSPHQPAHEIPLPHRARHKHTDETIWDIISKCNHTTTLTKLAGTNAEFKHLLQDPKQNITLFAPSDHAFHKLLPHGLPDKLPKEMVYRVLNYHTAEGTVTSYEMMHRNTIVSRLQEDRLGKGMHQRLRIGLDNVHGPSVNFFSELTVVDIYAKNGVIHAINNVLLPPPRISTILDLIPTEFSTTLSALYKTGLVNTLLPPDHQHPRSGSDPDRYFDAPGGDGQKDDQPPTFPLDHAPGLTVFAPSNRDWEQLGPMCVAYLFSSHGADHLKALMKYHIVPNLTLYSDALDDPIHTPASSSSSSSDEHTIPQGHNHYTFKTLLEGADINVDIVRWERYLSFRVDGWGKIVVSDGLAGDGVLQVPGRVLVPGGKWVGEMGVQELKGRLDRVAESAAKVVGEAEL